MPGGKDKDLSTNKRCYYGSKTVNHHKKSKDLCEGHAADTVTGDGLRNNDTSGGGNALEKRVTISRLMLLVIPQIMDVMAQRAMPHISGFLRPKVSLKGPKKSCPTAIPTIVVVIVSCTMGAEA